MVMPEPDQHKPTDEERRHEQIERIAVPNPFEPVEPLAEPSGPAKDPDGDETVV